MTLDPIYMDKESWTKFLELLAAKSVEVLEEELASSAKVTLPLQRFLSDQGPPVRLEGDFIRVARPKDPEAELIQVCRDIKRRIVDDGIKPGEIAVVLNNFSERAREFSRKLDEYGVPVKVSGEEPLSSSIAVQLFNSALPGGFSRVSISSAHINAGSRPGTAGGFAIRSGWSGSSGQGNQAVHWTPEEFSAVYIV